MAKRKKAGRRTSSKPRARASNTDRLGSLGTTELARELHRRRTAVGKLQRKRDLLIIRIAEIDAELNQHGVHSGGRRRPRNESKLADALAALLKDNPLTVTDAAEAVQAAGYRTTSPNFRTIVNQTVLKDKRFKRVSRGVYRS